MGRKPVPIEITLEDVAFIFNDNMDNFLYITQHCFCVQCNKGYEKTITNFRILLNNLFDIQLEGFCLDCGHSMRRYIETGDNAKTVANAESVWKTNKTLRELKIKKNKN